MSAAEPSRRRNRVIAGAAGVITVGAIVLAFASGYLGEKWQWLRPAGELLLLAELVGLIVLERHQLFEPVSEQVSGMGTNIADIRATLNSANFPEMHAALRLLSSGMNAMGQVTLCEGAPEVVRASMRAAREALGRDHEAPQVLRIGALSGRIFAERRWGLAEEIQRLLNTFSAFYLQPDSPSDSRARRWSVRMILAITSADTFDLWLKGPGGKILKLNPVNWEVKIVARSRAEAMLSPSFISDREVLLTHDDTNEVWNWGVLFQGQRYVSFFARWFDDMWGSIADTQMIYSRGRLNQAGVDAVRKALEAMESVSNKDALSINPESR